MTGEGAKGAFEPVRLPPASPEELVYALPEERPVQGSQLHAADQWAVGRRPRSSRKARPVTREDREMVNRAIMDGTVKVTRCAPGYSAHILPRTLREL